MEMKKLLVVDDYQEAWRQQDAGQGWIAYRDEVDYFCPSDVIGFDRDRMDGGVGGMSTTETRLVGFLYEIQPKPKKADLSDLYEYAKDTGIPVAGDSIDIPRSPMTKDMLEHEPYLLEDPEAGEHWKRLRKEARLEYALLVYCLYRQKWAQKWVQMTNRVLLELEKHGLEISQLRSLRRIDALSLELARDYKKAAVHVPKRLSKTLIQLERVASVGSAISSSALPGLRKQLAKYKSFLVEYKQRRKRRFESLAEYHLQTLAGQFKDLLKEPRGSPSLENLARRVSKAVFIELADELMHAHGVSMKKSTLLAGRITCLLFPNERMSGKAEPFERTFAKNVLNEYKYAKDSLGSV